jgi:signal transduction histidine kinase
MGEGLTVLRVGNAGEDSGADIIDVNDVAGALTTLEERAVDGVFLPAERATPDVDILRDHHTDIPIVLVGSEGAPGENRARALRTATAGSAVDRLTQLLAERDAESALREHRGLRRAVGRIAADTATQDEPATVLETALDHLLSTDRFRFGFRADRSDDGSVLELPGAETLTFEVTATEAAVDDGLDGSETTVIADSDPPAIVVPIGAGRGLVLFTADGSTPDPGERRVLDDLAALLGDRRSEANGQDVAPDSTGEPTTTGQDASESPDATSTADEAGGRETDVLVEMLAHELRSPLDLGRGRLEMAVEEGDEEDIERAIETFDRIDDVVSAGVSLARLETGEEEPVDLADRARSVWDGTATAAATLDVELDGFEPVEADPSLLDRLLSNLFKNAVEHGSTSPRSTSHEDAVEQGSSSQTEAVDEAGGPAPGGTTVRIGTLEDGAGFFVSDDGEGIDPADRDRILEPGVSLGENGTGYGLAIVDRVATAHEWDVSVGESVEGGARFDIRTA